MDGWEGDYFHFGKAYFQGLCQFQEGSCIALKSG